MRPSAEQSAPSPWPLLFARLVDLADAAGASPLTKHANCWEHDLDRDLRVVANGHHVPVPDAAGEHVPAFTFHVWRGDALLAAVTPNGVFPGLDVDTKLEVLTAIDRALAAQAAAPVAELDLDVERAAQEAEP